MPYESHVDYPFTKSSMKTEWPELVTADRTMIQEVYRALSMSDNLRLPGCAPIVYRYWMAESIDSWS